MAADPNIRASDEDRDKTASLLREHHAVGRLTAEEFNERLDSAYAAKTVGELDALLADLPGIDLYRLPDANLQRGRHVPGHSSALAAMAEAAGELDRAHIRMSTAWQAAWGSWFTTSLILFVVWAISGFGYPWPLWVAGPWGAILLGRWITGHHPSGRPPRRRPELPGSGQDQIGGPPSG
jgi:Domain of unknown function (DUF1707)